MTKTLYEKINTTCEHGHYAIVYNPIGKYFIVSPNKDIDGLWRETEVESTLTDAASSLGSDIGSEKEVWDELEAKGWIYAGVYHPPSPKPYEVGQKVSVSELTRKFEGFKYWTAAAKNMVGQISKITEVKDGVYGLGYIIQTPDSLNSYCFRHEWLEPVFDDVETNTKEAPKTIVIDGKEYDLIPKE